MITTRSHGLFLPLICAVAFPFSVSSEEFIYQGSFRHIDSNALIQLSVENLCIHSDFFSEVLTTVILFFFLRFIFGECRGGRDLNMEERKTNYILAPTTSFWKLLNVTSPVKRNLHWGRAGVSELCALVVCVASGPLGSFHQPWCFIRLLSSVFEHYNELPRQFCSCTSFCVLSSNHWPACWPKINDLLCGSPATAATAEPGSSESCLQKLLLYSEGRCSLNTGKMKRILYHFTLFCTIYTSADLDLLRFLEVVKNTC